MGGILCKKFNYKLIHNLVYSGYILSKWKLGVSNKCVVCGKNETAEHMLFECDRVKNIWKIVGEILKLDISWHHNVLGLDEINAKQINVTRNNIITIITYSIYALWVKCGETKESFKYLNIVKNVHNYLHYYMKMFQNFSKKEEWLTLFYKWVQDILHIIN